jgi:hypothetical protein
LTPAIAKIRLQGQCFGETGCAAARVTTKRGNLAQVMEHERQVLRLTKRPKQRQSLLVAGRRLIVIAFRASQFAKTVRGPGNAPHISQIISGGQALFDQRARPSQVRFEVHLGDPEGT